MTVRGAAEALPGSPAEQPCPFDPGAVAVLRRQCLVCRREEQERVLDHVVELGPWLTRDTLLVAKERWPSRDLFRWDLRTGRLHAVFGRGARVVTDVRRSGEFIGLSRRRRASHGGSTSSRTTT